MITCSVCKKPINGEYIRYKELKLNICKKCADKLKYCKICKKPLLNETPKNGICNDCLSNLKQCASCGNLIVGRYIPLNGKYYCENCGIRCASCGKKIKRAYQREGDSKFYCKSCIEKFSEIQCDTCKKPISRYYEKDGKKYCSSCYKKLHGETCSLCGKKLLQYVEIDGKAYCKKCSQTKHCVSCHLPIGEDGIRIDDHMYSCKSCYDNALLKHDDLVDISNKVIRLLEKHFYMNIPKIDHLILTDLKGLRRQKKWTSRNTKGIFINKNGERSIYILRGISKNYAIGTITHELAHFWQNNNGIRSDDIKFIEGFAEWVSYKVYTKLKLFKQIEAMESNKYDEYTIGLGKFRELESQVGVKGVFNYVKTHKHI